MMASELFEIDSTSILHYSASFNFKLKNRRYRSLEHLLYATKLFMTLEFHQELTDPPKVELYTRLNNLLASPERTDWMEQSDVFPRRLHAQFYRGLNSLMGKITGMRAAAQSEFREAVKEVDRGTKFGLSPVEEDNYASVPRPEGLEDWIVYGKVLEQCKGRIDQGQYDKEKKKKKKKPVSS